MGGYYESQTILITNDQLTADPVACYGMRYTYTCTYIDAHANTYYYSSDFNAFLSR